MRINRGNKMKFIKPALVTTMTMALSLSGFSVMAEEQQPIIVTATKTAQTADETIAPVIIIDRREIESNPTAAISDLLNKHAGIDIGRNGGPGQQTSIFIRGAESNHTLVMIDGLKINPGTLGTAAIQNIDLDMVERIEIVKGPRSTLYGSEAIGGVINIITRKGKEGSQYSVNAGYGSYNTRTLGISAHNKVGDRAAGINIKTNKTAGYAIRTTSPIIRGNENLSIHAYGKKRMGETNLQISHWLSKGMTEYLNFSLKAVDQSYENSTTAIDVENNFSDNWLSKIKISRILDKIDQNQGADYADTQRDAFDWQNDIQISDDQLLTAGIYISNENTKASVFGTSFDKTTQSNALFIQDDILLGQHHLIAGIRYLEHETFGSHNTGSIDYSWQVAKPLKFFAGIASGFRAPDSTDRFSSTGNPNLLPEESVNKEIGIQLNMGKQQKIRVNYYNNEITNLIEYDSGTSKMQNIATAQINGTEVEYQYKSNSWSLNAGANFQKPENKATGVILSRRSEVSYTGAINYHNDNVTIGMDMRYTGERDNSAYDTKILKSYTLININTKFKLAENLSLKARIENLADEVYELASTYRTPERSYYIDLVYDF